MILGSKPDHLHCIALYCIVLYYIVLRCIVLHCIALYCMVLHCLALYCIALYCIVLHCLVLHCIYRCFFRNLTNAPIIHTHMHTYIHTYIYTASLCTHEVRSNLMISTCAHGTSNPSYQDNDVRSLVDNKKIRRAEGPKACWILTLVTRRVLCSSIFDKNQVLWQAGSANDLSSPHSLKCVCVCFCI